MNKINPDMFLPGKKYSFFYMKKLYNNFIHKVWNESTRGRYQGMKPEGQL
jgi:hypothetical protein